MNVVGYIAGALTTLAFLPQVVRSLRMRDASGLSWIWLVAFGTGVSGWIVYGVGRGDLAITGTNAITLLAVLALIWLRATTLPRGPHRAPAPACTHSQGGRT